MRTRASSQAFDDITDLAAPVASAIAGTTASRAAPCGAAVADGRLSRDRLASHQKLERELAHAERKGDPRARAAELRRWKSISKSVSRHMQAKYGEDR